jgi:hypothetical protein
MRRKSPGPPESVVALLRSQPEQAQSALQTVAVAQGAPGAPGALAAAAAAAAAASSLSSEYSAEADLVRRQTAALLALLAQSVDARDGGAASTSFRVPSRRGRGAAATAAAATHAAAAGASATAKAPGGGGLAAALGAFAPGSLSKSSVKGSFSTTVTALAAGTLSGTGSSPSPRKSFGGSSSASGSKAAPAPAAGRSSRKGPLQGRPPAMNVDDLEAARDLLSIQTGGNGWFLISRLKEEIAAGMAAAAAAAGEEAAAKLGPAGGASAAKGCGALQAAAQLNGSACWWGRQVSEGAFGVLADMVEAIVTTAALQEDWRVVVAALQMADCISCCTGAWMRPKGGWESCRIAAAQKVLCETCCGISPDTPVSPRPTSITVNTNSHRPPPAPHRVPRRLPHPLQ